MFTRFSLLPGNTPNLLVQSFLWPDLLPIALSLRQSFRNGLDQDTKSPSTARGACQTSALVQHGNEAENGKLLRIFKHMVPHSRIRGTTVLHTLFKTVS